MKLMKTMHMSRNVLNQNLDNTRKDKESFELKYVINFSRFKET